MCVAEFVQCYQAGIDFRQWQKEIVQVNAFFIWLLTALDILQLQDLLIQSSNGISKIEALLHQSETESETGNRCREHLDLYNAETMFNECCLACHYC